MHSMILPWEQIEAIISVSARVLLYGPPGTGKTTSAFNAADALGLNAYAVVLTEETPAAELRGHYVPDGNEWKFRHGPAAIPFMNGGMLLLDEIDKASGDSLDFLHGLLTDKDVARMTLPNGETIRPHPDFRVVATMNGRLEDLPDAIRDRFAIAIEISNPHPNAIESLPEDLRNAASNPESYENLERPATMRAWKAFADLRERFGVETAAKAVFGNRSRQIIDAYKLGGEPAPEEEFLNGDGVEISESFGEAISLHSYEARTGVIVSEIDEDGDVEIRLDWDGSYRFVPAYEVRHR